MQVQRSLCCSRQRPEWNGHCDPDCSRSSGEYDETVWLSARNALTTKSETAQD